MILYSPRLLDWKAAGLAAIVLLAFGRPLLAEDQAATKAEETASQVEPKAAKPAVPQSGRLIHVPLPLAGDADASIKRRVGQAQAELPTDGPRPILVLEFSSSENRSGEGSDFSRALAVAQYLSGPELSRYRTVAYIPQALKGHAVLPALACEELIMAPEATIGEAGIDEKSAAGIDATMRTGYRQISDRRRTIPTDVVLGMLDKEAVLLKVVTDQSIEYVLESNLPELEKTRKVQSKQELKRAGELAQFSGREARELGFVKYLASDREALAHALNLPPETLEDDPSHGEKWVAMRVDLSGPVNSNVVARVQRAIEDRIRNDHVNFICVYIDSPGGSLEDSISLANFLSGLDRTKVRTVAYVPSEALGDAALVAIACDQLVVLPGAALGGPGEATITPQNAQAARRALRESLGNEKGRSWSLAAALIDPNLPVYRMKNSATGRTAFFSEEELRELKDADQWKREREITRRGRPLRLTGAEAGELGLARHVVNNFEDLKSAYGLESDPLLSEQNWAHALIEALASPGIAWLLLLIGIVALYAELQAPGIGVAGFVAGICFLLFFWSKYLHGTAGWLEVLLFLAGICCVLLEVFVLPGSGIFGLGGGLMIMTSVVLASQTFVLPRNDYQMQELTNSLLALVGVVVAVVATALVMRRFFPRTPMLGRMVLEPPSGEELETISHREALVNWDDLLGRHGLTATQLTPSGKARFGDRLVDVIADGDVIERGAEVIVVEVQGNRVLVQRKAGG